MSYTEINDHFGMHYGGINEDEIIRKLEITDPELVDDIKGNDDFHTIEAEYDGYARGEIVDWGPDNVYLESDRPQRDPALTRSILNLHYGGTRGSNPNLPMHPEMFIGFTGNDPRGADTEPRFDQMRGHATTRAISLSSRFQESNDSFIADRPWTDVSRSYAMKDLHQRLAGNTKVFTTEKVNYAAGRNIPLEQMLEKHSRRHAIKDGSDGLFIPEQDQPQKLSAMISEAFTNGRSDSKIPNIKALKKQWNSVNDSDLEINVFKAADSKKSVAQNKHVSQSTMSRDDGDYGEEHITQEQKKTMARTLSVLMSLATKRFTKEDAENTDSEISAEPTHNRLDNIAGHAIKNTGEDQDRQPTILEDDSKDYKSKNPTSDSIRGGYNQQGSQDHSKLMGDIQTMIQKMNQPANTRKAHQNIDQSVQFGPEHNTVNRGKSVEQINDIVSMHMKNINGEVNSAAASKGLEINVYKTSKLPKHKLPNTTSQQMFIDAMNGQMSGKSKKPEFTAHKTNNSKNDISFNANYSVTGGHGAAKPPTKLRAREHGDLNMGENVGDEIQGA